LNAAMVECLGCELESDVGVGLCIGTWLQR